VISIPGTGGAQIVGQYRYTLHRRVGSSQDRVLFIMLNPSTADGMHDDPTVRRCIRFAQDWGFGELEVCNLFALRATDPRLLKTVADPIGPLNDDAIRRASRRSEIVVTAWGALGARSRRASDVAAMLSLKATYCLGRTTSGAPRHPLYLPKSARLMPFP